VSDATGGDDATGQPASLPQRRVSINQLVGYNVTAYRTAAELTQEEFGRPLGWSAASVSAAERSWEGRRIRKFDSDELARIADRLGIPVIALLLPPPDAGTAVDYVFDFGTAAPAGLAEMLAHLIPTYALPETPAFAAYRARLMALGAFSETAVDDIVIAARREAEQFTSDARARVEGLEQDAREQHRRAMNSLVASRIELEKRVEDLRRFEREYRSRLLAFLEEHLRDLRAGAQDSGVLPPLSEDGGQPERRPGSPGSGA
jgi:transcriptional regulator with XRE-family HTH domain